MMPNTSMKIEVLLILLHSAHTFNLSASSQSSEQKILETSPRDLSPNTLLLFSLFGNPSRSTEHVLHLEVLQFSMPGSSRTDRIPAWAVKSALPMYSQPRPLSASVKRTESNSAIAAAAKVATRTIVRSFARGSTEGDFAQICGALAALAGMPT